MEVKNIDQAVYKTFDNDIGILLDDKLIILIEHQSTLNNNMPFRFLEYVCRLYSSMVPSRARYQQSLYKIPTPEFYMVYTGKGQLESTSLRLSDAYKNTDSQPFLELEVQILNARDRNLSMYGRCGILEEYMEFLRMLEEEGDLKNPDICRKVIQKAIERGLLKDYLERKSTEVINMTFAEYNYEEDIAVKTEEARLLGEQNANLKNARNMLCRTKLLLEEIADITGLSLDKVEELAAELKGKTE